MTRLPSLGPHGEGWVLIQVILVVCVGAAGLAGRGAWSGAPALVTAVLGIGLLGGALTLVLRAARDLGPGFTGVPRPRSGASLVETGVYALVRHPIYSGLIAGALGWSLVLASPLALPFVVLLALVLDLKSRREEVWLRERYPGYEAYAARTRRLIPRLY